MDLGAIGLVGGIVGSVIGVLGAIIGTYFSIKNTKTEAERVFAVRCALGVWIAGTLLMFLPLVLWLVGLIPQWLYWIAYALFYYRLCRQSFGRGSVKWRCKSRNDL